jgi:hypothetical protein
MILKQRDVGVDEHAWKAGAFSLWSLGEDGDAALYTKVFTTSLAIAVGSRQEW